MLSSVIFKTKLSKLIKDNFGIEVSTVYTSFKIANYFSLKCRTPNPSCFKCCVHKFTCLHDAGETYIGMTARHLTTRVSKHLSFDIPENKSSIKDRVMDCEACQSGNLSVTSSKNMQKWFWDSNSRSSVSLKIKTHFKCTNDWKWSFIFIENLLIVLV